MTPAEKHATARFYLETLRRNSYPGRGILVGLDETGTNLVQATFVTGRSEPSKNRKYKDLGQGRVMTIVADTNKETGDPTKTIYTAMNERDRKWFLISNGRQTDVIFAAYAQSQFYKDMFAWGYEDDSIYTPRITAECVLTADEGYMATMSILRRSQFGDGCDRNFFSIDGFTPGIGHCITTYGSDGNPPPHFQGEPFPLPLPGNVEDISRAIWNALPPDKRVCLAIKLIPLNGSDRGVSEKPHIINEDEKPA